MSTITGLSSEQKTFILKRNGNLEEVDISKIVKSIERHSVGLKVDPTMIAVKTIGGIHNGASSAELDKLSIRTAASYVFEEPEYSKLAARILSSVIDKEVSNQGITSFSESVKLNHSLGLISDDILHLVSAYGPELDSYISHDRDNLFEYFGLTTVYDRYLMRHPETRLVVERPQYWLMRVTCGIASTLDEIYEMYDALSQFKYMTSTPTLFNSGTLKSQMSSCYIMSSPRDDLKSIFDKYSDIAQLSKWSGGIGLSMSLLRSTGSHIKGTNGSSNGIIPWMKILDSTISAVDQGGGKRKGSACVYLEPWHADIEDFLQAKDNTGDHMRRTHHLNLANWIPDEFMRRVRDDQDWSLFDPADTPLLHELYGDAFDSAYREAEARGLAKRVLPARDLYGKMMRTLAQTGNGWMTFKDSTNNKSNQSSMKYGNIVHSSNLCSEIVEVNDYGNETISVCNLASINLAKHCTKETVQFGELRETVATAIKFLDKVIDVNFYPVEDASTSNNVWRPVGLGVMGLQDVFFTLGIPFDSDDARRISKRIAEEIYFVALKTSLELAKQYGAHEGFAKTKAAEGVLQFDLWGVEPSGDLDWDALREEIKVYGLRNSLLVAIAPTATIASIVGAYECIEPQLSNLFKRETLSGEFLQVNKYLVDDLKALGLWNENIRAKIREASGSIQNIVEIPERLRHVYRSAWEIPMRSLIDMAADRGAFIDQSQSLNLFVSDPNIGKLSSMYMYAWEKGLKTTYYLRSRAATRIRQVVESTSAVSCSLENPETCGSCQ